MAGRLPMDSATLALFGSSYRRSRGSDDAYDGCVECPGQNLPVLRSADELAEKVGAKLGTGEVLL